MPRRPPVALPSLFVACLALALPAQAQLVRAAPPKTAVVAPPQRAVDFLAERATKAGRPSEADKFVDGLPDPVLQMLYADNSYLENGERHLNQSVIDRNLTELRALAAKFDVRWAEYLAQKTKVDAALQQAASLRAAGKLAEAKLALIAAVMPVDRLENGGFAGVNTSAAGDRPMLEARDADVPALVELEDLVEATHDQRLAFEVAAALFTRRRVLDRSEECVLWIQNSRNLGAYVEDRRSTALFEGRALAAGVYHRIFSALAKPIGVRPDEDKGVKKGQWVLASFLPDSIDAKQAKYTFDGSFPEFFNCAHTNKVEAIDLKTGEIQYEERCNTRMIKRVARVAISFADPPPAWAKERQETPFFVGRVVAAGPNWVLDQGFVPDLRFMRPF